MCITPQSCLTLEQAQQLNATDFSTPSWRDAITFDVTRATSAVSQQGGALIWLQNGQRSFTFPFTVIADGHPHTVVLPVGIHPQWRDTVQHVQLVFPNQDVRTIHVTNLRIVQRPWWAVDQLLLSALFPALPEIPPWSTVVLLIALLVGGSSAALLPWRTLRRRLTIAGVMFGRGMGLWTLTTQLALVSTIAPAYGGLSDTAVASRVPLYDTNGRATAQLATAAPQLPDGPVLLLDVRPVSDVLHYAQYVFYPRRVDVRSPQDKPTAIPDLLTKEYVAVIQAQPNGRAPLASWQALDLPAEPLAIWRSSAAPARSQPPPTWPGGVLGLCAGLLTIALVGWSLGGVLSWRGWLRVGAMWPLGTIVWAWWMWAVNVIGLPWSWITIALPLGLAALLALWFQRATLRQMRWRMPPLRWHWNIGGGVLVAVLVGGELIQATLLPSMDRDSWTMWGLKAKAFALDGAIEPVLTLYRQFEPHHASYPPAQPLVMAWLFTALGGVSERLGKSMFPLWYLSGVGLVWAACRRWVGDRWAWAWALLMATTPIILDHATINNADLPLAVVLLLGAITLITWIDEGAQAALIGGMVVLAGAAWLKPDGIFLGAGVLGAAVLVRALALRQQRMPVLPLLRTAALAGVSFVALTAPWLLYARALGLNSDIPSVGAVPAALGPRLRDGVAVILAEIVFSYNNSAQGLLGGGYGAIWIICLSALGLGWRRLKADPIAWFLLLSMFGGILFYLAVYIVRPYYSIDRYLLHLVPLLVLAAARSSLPAPEINVIPSAAARGRKTVPRGRSRPRVA